MLLRPSWSASPIMVPLYPWLAQEIAQHLGAIVVYRGDRLLVTAYTMDAQGHVERVTLGHPRRDMIHVAPEELSLDLMQLTTRALVLTALAARLSYRAPWMLGYPLTALTEEQAAVALAKTIRLVGSDPKLSAHPLPRAVLGPWQHMPPVFAQVAGRERRVIAGEWFQHASGFNGGWASLHKATAVTPLDAQGRRGREGGDLGERLADGHARATGALLIEDLTLAAHLATRPSAAAS